jgi:hypothetical protein
MIPLEDNASDIIGKAQRGLRISDGELQKKRGSARKKSVNCGRAISMSWRFCALRRFWVSPREHFVSLPRANGTPKKLIRWTASISSTAIITLWPLTHISSGTHKSCGGSF